MADDTKNSGGQGEKKLHIDSGWKAEVQAEKERLEREARERKAAEESNRRKREAGIIGSVGGKSAPAEGPVATESEAAEGEEAERGLPPASFQTLVQSLATQALMFLSPERDPRTGRSMQNLELAKHTVDLLSVLEEKTRGNLSDEEKRLLDTALYQTRMAYVQASRIM